MCYMVVTLIKKSLAKNKNYKINRFPEWMELIFDHKSNNLMNFFYNLFRNQSIQGEKFYLM